MFIEVKNVSYWYGYKSPIEKKVLYDINLKIDKGEFIGLIGKTGSGKSTLVQLMNGLLIPQLGDVIVDGINTKEKDKLKIIRRKVGLVFQYPEYQLFEETVYKDIAYGPKNLGFSENEIQEKIDELIDLLEIPKDVLSRSPFELSGGQKRRVAIAGILSMDPECIILDEPTAGLDPRGRRRIFEIIKRLNNETNKTIILISHSIEDVALLCDRIVILRKGIVTFDGSKHDCFTNINILEQSGLIAPEILYLQKRLENKGFIFNGYEYDITKLAQKIAKNLMT